MSKFQRAELGDINPLDLFSAFIQPEPGAEPEDRSARYMPRNIAAEGGTPTASIPPEAVVPQPAPAVLQSAAEPPSPVSEVVNNHVRLDTGTASLDGRIVVLTSEALSNIRGIVAIAIADQLAAEAQAVLNKHCPETAAMLQVPHPTPPRADDAGV